MSNLHVKECNLAVIIPCWNCEDYIGEMLDCLQKQTYSDWKAFIVDDGCTDGTAEIIKHYSTNDVRIHYFKRNREPKGAQTCRNIGFQLSEGAKYVVFFDADDLIAPYCFEQRVSSIENKHGFDFLSFPAKAFSTSILDELRWGFGIKGPQEMLLSLLNWRTLSIVVSTNIYRRESLVEKGLIWDERLLSMQDSDYNIQSLCFGMHHGFVEGAKIDYYYRYQEESVSKHIYKKEHFESHLYLINKEVMSIRKVFGDKLVFFLKAYIVVFFEFFKKDKWPYKQLLKQSFVMKNPFFALRLIAFIVLGLRGKKILFGTYCQYNENSIRKWKSYLEVRLSEMILQ